MEDLKPICEVEQNSFCVELLKRLDLQRKQNYLCDITLVAKEGKEFKAHKNVLSAASPFFVKLFQSEMREKEEKVIRFEEISELILAEVLKFIYTGTVEINETNASDLIIAAEYLLIEGLKTKSGRYLEQQMTSSNCISTFRLAEKYRCEELVANSTKFILDNLASVAESEEFLNLKAEEVEKWISNDEISLAAEEDVFRIVVNWIEHDKSERKGKFQKLFGQVRLILLSRDSLMAVVTHELVQDDLGCLRKVLDTIDVIRTASEDTIINVSPRKRLETHAIVVGGGDYFFCYLPEKDAWKSLSYLRGQQQNISQDTKMINFQDQLYTFHHRFWTQRYDPVFNSWSSLKLEISYSTDRTECVGVCRGQIYAIDVGVYESTGKTSTVKKYDVESYQWQTVHSSDSGCRYNSCSVVAGNCLYLLGGKAPRDRCKEHDKRYMVYQKRPVDESVNNAYVATAEGFNTVENQWKRIADMQQERGDAFGMAFQGKIFVAGGQDRSGKELDSCEVYSIATNEWQLIGSLNVPRVSGSMLSVNGTIYVLGGSQPGFPRHAYTVEVYDPLVNKWTKKTTIPLERIPEGRRSSFKGCALKLSRGVLDKIE